MRNIFFGTSVIFSPLPTYSFSPLGKLRVAASEEEEEEAKAAIFPIECLSLSRSQPGLRKVLQLGNAQFCRDYYYPDIRRCCECRNQVFSGKARGGVDDKKITNCAHAGRYSMYRA